MALYPTSVPIDEGEIARLIKTYKTAYLTIYSQIADATDFGQANRKAILFQVEKTLEALGEDTQAFIDKNVPFYYETGADTAVTQMQKIKYPVEIKTGYNRVHRQAIQALVSDTAKAFGEGLSGVNRSINRFMSQSTREAITQQLATGSIGGSANREIQRNLITKIREQGLDALIDRGGHKWTLERYTDMLIRTKFTEARNTGLKNRMVENNLDLVQISDHNSTHKECNVWEGKILSITGKTKGFKTLMEAEQAGLFHPNCKHAMNVMNLELARETLGWNPDYIDPKTGKRGRYEQGLI